jgi:hypothetical protein
MKMAESDIAGGADFPAGGGGLTYRSSSAASDGISGSNATGGKLWLPIWAGEVINAYDEYNMFESLVGSKTIASGTTMEFPITGTVTLHPSWNAGQELIGGEDATASTFKVSLDKRPMAAHFEIDNVDLMQTQWEFRSELARQAAQTLSNARDKQLYSYICRAALTDQVAGDPRPSLNLNEALYGSDSSDSGNLKDWGTSLATADNRALGALTALSKIEKYIVYLQENNIPYGNLYCAVSPACFMDIRALGVARAVADAKDSQPMFGGVAQAGGLGAPFTQSLGAMHDALEYMGCTIIKTNHGSDQMRNLSAGTTIGEAKYNIDFSMGEVGLDTTLITHGIRAVMWTPDCVASLRLQGLKVDNVDDVRRNTSFTVASMMAGTGVLRPECAAIIHTKDGAHASTDTRTELRHADYADVDADGYVQG